jgi:hypothetical protein
VRQLPTWYKAVTAACIRAAADLFAPADTDERRIRDPAR